MADNNELELGKILNEYSNDTDDIDSIITEVGAVAEPVNILAEDKPPHKDEKPDISFAAADAPKPFGFDSAEPTDPDMSETVGQEAEETADDTAADAEPITDPETPQVTDEDVVVDSDAEEPEDARETGEQEASSDREDEPEKTDEEILEEFLYEENGFNRGAGFTMRTSDDRNKRKPATSQREYNKRGEEPIIKTQIERLKNNLAVRAAVLLFAAVFSLFITIANDLSMPLAPVFDLTVNPSAYLFANTILGIIAVGFSYSVVTLGLKNLVKLSPDTDTIASLNIVIAIIAGLIMLFDPESLKAGFYHVYTAVAITGLLFNTLGKLSVVRRAERNFDYVAEGSSFAALQHVDDDTTVAYITNGSAGSSKELALMRKTSFIKDFVKNSYSSDLGDLFAEKTAPFMLIAAVAVGALSLIFEKESSGKVEKLYVFLASMSGTLALCSSFALAFVANLPLSKASRKLLDYSGVVLGYSSVEEYAEVNSVMIDSGHLFPTGTVEFVNLKMLGSVMIDKGILYAASLAYEGKSVTQPAFYKMLRGELQLLMPVKNCISEDGMGISGWIDNEKMLLGGRDLMEKHGIDGLPPMTAEDAFADGNCVMYLAVSGRAAMMFAVSLSVGAAAERWIQELEDEHIDIHVRCSDGFITRQLIARMFDISPSTVRILPSSCDADCEELTEPIDALSASMFCSGHLPTFSMLLVAAKRVKFAANMGVAIQYGSLALALLISVIMMLLGSFAQITPTIVVIYNIAFLLLTVLMQSFRRI